MTERRITRTDMEKRENDITRELEVLNDMAEPFIVNGLENQLYRLKDVASRLNEEKRNIRFILDNVKVYEN